MTVTVRVIRLTVESRMVKDLMLLRMETAEAVILPAVDLAVEAVQILITPLLLK